MSTRTPQLRDRLFARIEPIKLGPEGRAGFWVLLLFIVGGAWASWAEIDERIRTPAKVIVSSRSQIVQSVDGGVLTDLNVREGDIVKGGELLAVLDPTRTRASADEIVAKTLSLKAVMQRLEAEISDQPLKFDAELRRHPLITRSEARLYERRRQALDQELSAIEETLELATQELEALKRLAATGDASSTEVLRSQRQVTEMQAAMTNRRNTYYQEAQAELSRARGELQQSLQVLAQRQEALEATKLYAPMSGVVNNVRFTTIGAVLRPGEELLQIVPSDEPLVVEARVPPRDVAFVRRGLKANVKLDAYDYAIYGGFKGEVVYISPDTLEDQESGGQQEDPAYRVHVQIEPDAQTNRPQSGEKIEIIPGMTATVEIITGRRTVAQYLLKPIRRVRDNALTER
ncbi:HlyD family efflux transporter periplasmic adaptor subunit [Polycyclovorans algicola]|uniref:HlyD family efflux transporter periplasmic adaptor subunit n=1 Tax=Polycyclovorans algicola TaxID=616992 RepID=UPI0006933621|nr:HlyD family efflux transporter periplasmic adaptor subunit [Polycyclovorans algicola]